MFSQFEMKKTVSAVICTILFSTTMVLSAVGPAKAASSTPTASPVVAHLA